MSMMTGRNRNKIVLSGFIWNGPNSAPGRKIFPRVVQAARMKFDKICLFKRFIELQSFTVVLRDNS